MSNPIIMPSESIQTGALSQETNTKELNSKPEQLSFQNVMAKLAHGAPGAHASPASAYDQNAQPAIDVPMDGMRQETAAPSVSETDAMAMLGNWSVPLLNANPTNTSATGTAEPLVVCNTLRSALVLEPTGNNPSSIAQPASFQGVKLKQLAIGPTLTVVTSDQPAPSEATLREFAQQQGLDDAAIRWLFSGAPKPALATRPTTDPMPTSAGLQVELAANGQTLLTGAEGPMVTAANLNGSSATPSGPQAFRPASILDFSSSLTAQNPTPGHQDFFKASGTSVQQIVPTQALAPPFGVGITPPRGSTLINGLIGHATGPEATAASKLQSLTEVDLTQDPAVDWKAWLKGLAPLQGADRSGEAMTRSDSLLRIGDASSGFDMSLGTDFQEGLGQGTASPPAFQTPTASTEFKPELAKAQEGMSSRSMVLSGQDLADKMSDAIGKRILESIAKGDWQVKINLKPTELGHIEVDLRMKGNALEAHFSTSHLVTRDLLENGLGRLRETLQMSGTDVASIRVNDGQSSRNGGDSTPRHAHTGGQEPNSRGELSTETTVAAMPQTRSSTDGGLDLMV